MSYNLRFPVPQQFVNIPKNMIYTYNKRGGVDKIEYPEFDVTKEFVYNARGFVSSLVAKGKNGQVLFTQSLGRDYMGNILQQISQHTGANPLIQNYVYDDLNRLTAWNNNSNNSETYTYDDMGNRTAATKNGVSHTYSYSSGKNQLDSLLYQNFKRAYSYNGIGAVNKIEHFENNNLVLEEFFEYNSGTIVKNYRKKNNGTNPFADVAFTTNPITYSNNEWQWSYRQSALGGREQKRLLTSPHSDETAINGKIFAHLWEYSLLGAGGEELIFYKGFQVNTSTSAPSNDSGRRVYMGVQRYMVNGGEIQINASGEMELHITDHLGNVRVITNKTGTVLKKFDYKPFGEILWSNSPTPRKGFESAELDSENGYISMGARTYCQDIGRFLQPDPLFEAFARHTPYHYSYNSPLVWLDPSGLAPEKEKGEERLLEYVNPIIFEEGEYVYMRGFTQQRMAWCLADAEYIFTAWQLEKDIYDAEQTARGGGGGGNSSNGTSGNTEESGETNSTNNDVSKNTDSGAAKFYTLPYSVAIALIKFKLEQYDKESKRLAEGENKVYEMGVMLIRLDNKENIVGGGYSVFFQDGESQGFSEGMTITFNLNNFINPDEEDKRYAYYKPIAQMVNNAIYRMGKIELYGHTHPPYLNFDQTPSENDFENARQLTSIENFVVFSTKDSMVRFYPYNGDNRTTNYSNTGNFRGVSFDKFFNFRDK